MSTALPNGIYYITSHFSQTVITLTNGAEGTNLTAWERYGGPEQQWNVSSLNGLYTFRNVAYGLYASFEGRQVARNPYTWLWARAAPFRFILEDYRSGFLIAGNSVGGNVLNLAGASYANNTPIIFWPLTVHDGPDNAVWFFNSTTAQTSRGGSTFNYVHTRQALSSGAIAGCVIGGLTFLVCLFALAFYLGRRNRGYPPSAPVLPSSMNKFSIDSDDRLTDVSIRGPTLPVMSSVRGGQVFVRPVPPPSSVADSSSSDAISLPQFSTAPHSRSRGMSGSYWSAAVPSTVGTVGRRSPTFGSGFPMPNLQRGGSDKLASTERSDDAPGRGPTPPPKY